MKTHLPTKLRAALLAALLAYSTQAVQAITYNEDTVLKDSTTITESITVAPGVTVSIESKTDISAPSISLGDSSAVLVKHETYALSDLTVTGAGSITNDDYLQVSEKLNISGSTLINKKEGVVMLDGETTATNANFTNTGNIYVSGSLVVNNSVVDNNGGVLVIEGSADLVNSNLENAGTLEFTVDEHSRVGKAMLTIDAASVVKSDVTNALPKTPINVNVDTNDLSALLGNEYRFIEIEGFGSYGVSKISLDNDDAYKKEKGSNVYRSENGAYYFTMEEIIAGQSNIIGVKFGSDAAFISYIDDTDMTRAEAYGNIIYTTEEFINAPLTVGSGASIVLAKGGNLNVSALSITGSGSATIDGGQLTFSSYDDAPGHLDGNLLIKINGNTLSNAALVSGVTEAGLNGANLNVQIDTMAAGSLTGKTYNIVDGINLAQDSFSTTSGKINWTEGTIDTNNGGSFQLSFTYEDGKMAFTYGAAVNEDGTVTSKDFVVETPQVDAGTKLTLEQISVSGGTTATTVTTGSDTTNVLSSDLSDAVNVIYAEKVEGNTQAIATTTLVSSVKDGDSTIAQTSDCLVLNFEDNVSLENGTLGFSIEDPRNGEIVEVNGEKQIITTVDIIKNTGKKVTLTNMQANANLSMEMDGGEYNLIGSTITLGGKQLGEDVYKQLQVSNGTNSQTFNIETEKTAEALLNLHTNTVMKNGKLTIDSTNGNAAGFKASYMRDAAGNLDSALSTSVEFHGTEVDLKDADRGQGASHKATFGGDSATYQAIQMYNAHVHGTGHVQNIHMHGGQFGIGNSPGIMSITDSSFNGTSWTFHMITNATQNWVTDGANESAGDKFSQLKLDGANTAGGITIKLNYQTATGTGYTDAKKADFTTKFQNGASITLIDVSNGSISGDYTFDYTTLPELGAGSGLTWDTSRLFSTGAIYVVYEMTGDPSRIANTLCAAADATGSFGRLAMSQLNNPRTGLTNVWVQSFASSLDRDTVGGHTGFDSETSGFAVGADRKLHKAPVIVGASLGASTGTVKPKLGTASYNGGKIDQDGMQLGIYGRYTAQKDQNAEECLTVDGYITYGLYENDSRRNSLTTGKAATASWDEESWAMGVTVTRTYKVGDHAFISPYAGVEYTTADMDNFVERSQGEILYSADEAYRNLALILGVSAHRVYTLRNSQVITPYARIALSQDIMRQDAEVSAQYGSGTLTDKSAHQGRTALQFGTGANWQINQKWSVNAGYSVEARKDAVDQRANIGASYSF